jgi:RNA polymerase sigma factor (sigma-70 family)
MERFHELLAGCRKGDQEAWRQLLREFGPGLRIIVRSRLRREVRARFRDSDAMQETWLKAWQKLGDLEESATPKRFQGWLALIAEHVIEHAHRRHLHAQKRSCSNEQPLPASLLDPAARPDNLVAAEDVWESCLATFIDPRAQQAIRMRRQGLSTREIAKTLGVSGVTIFRILKQFQDMIQARLGSVDPFFRFNQPA